MGSVGALKGRGADRYQSGQRGNDASPDIGGKLVPEGIEGQVPYKGRLADYLSQLVGGLRSGMGYVGAALATPGTRLEAELRGKRLPVTVCPLPFHPTTYKR